MDTESPSSDAAAEQRFIVDFVSEVIRAAGASPCEDKKLPRAEQLILSFKSKLLPFLRCTAIFIHFLTNVPPPTKLKEASEIEPTDEYAILCHYLSLPSKFSLLLSSTHLRQLALSWCKHPRVICMIGSRIGKAKSPAEFPLKLIHQPHGVNRLIELPQDYSELINNVSQFTCPNSDSEDSRSPTMCLVCGAMLCSQSYCCQTELDGTLLGACTYHTHLCGAGVGVFLRIRDCKILLLAGKSKGIQVKVSLDHFKLIFLYRMLHASTIH